MKAVLAALAASAILSGAATISLIAPGGDDTSAAVVAGPYPGVLSEPPPDQATPRTSSTPTSSASTPAPTVSAPAMTPRPAALGAESTPAPAAEPSTPVSEQAPHERCPRLPILISPSTDLAAATEAAMAMWERYLGCDAFTVTPGGIAVKYEQAWPGACEEADIAACTYNGIFLSPLAPRYDPASVIAHELGHVLNFGHDDNPAVMSPFNWSGPSTVFCEVATRCR